MCEGFGSKRLGQYKTKHFDRLKLALKLEGIRRENFEILEKMSSRNEGMQFRLNE